MDIGTVLHAMVDKQRNETFSQSNQLSLGELILKLEAIDDKSKPCVLDFGGFSPRKVDSWRGIYKEIAINYDDSDPMTAEEFLTILKSAVGKEFHGYKGGDYIMSRQTPVWVANYGNSGLSDYKGIDYTNVGVVDIRNADNV